MAWNPNKLMKCKTFVKLFLGMAEVIFVNDVTAGGSVKFLPAVKTSPETIRFTILMKVQSRFYPDFISKTVDILIISSYNQKMPKILIFDAFTLLICERMSQITHFCSVKLLA